MSEGTGSASACTAAMGGAREERAGWAPDPGDDRVLSEPGEGMSSGTGSAGGGASVVALCVSAVCIAFVIGVSGGSPGSCAAGSGGILRSGGRSRCRSVCGV